MVVSSKKCCFGIAANVIRLKRRVWKESYKDKAPSVFQVYEIKIYLEC